LEAKQSGCDVIDLADEAIEHISHSEMAKIAKRSTRRTRGIDIIIDRAGVKLRVNHVTSNN
jgi:hypothetical protein